MIPVSQWYEYKQVPNKINPGLRLMWVDPFIWKNLFVMVSACICTNKHIGTGGTAGADW